MTVLALLVVAMPTILIAQRASPDAGASAADSVAPSVPRPTVSGPVTGGTGIDLPGTTTFPLRAVGYEQREYFLSGTATAYTSASSPLAPNGRWTVSSGQTAPYETRMVVYRPIDPKRFNGTVIVEWLNVSGGVDAAAAWLTGHVQMIRERDGLRRRERAGIGHRGVSQRGRRRDRRDRGHGPRAVRVAPASRRQLLVQHLPAGRSCHPA